MQLLPYIEQDTVYKLLSGNATEQATAVAQPIKAFSSPADVSAPAGNVHLNGLGFD